MSGPSFHHLALDNEFNYTSSSPTESDWRYRLFGPTSYFQPAHAATHMVSSTSDPSYALLNDILSSDNFPTGIPIQASATTARFSSFPSLPPPALPRVPITLDASDSHASYPGYPAGSGIGFLFSQREPHTIPTPAAIVHPHYGGALDSAHESSYGANGNHMASCTANYSHEIPLSSTAMSMATGPTLDVGVSSYRNPILRLGPVLPQSSGHRNSTSLNPLPFNSTPNLTLREGFDTEPHPSFPTPISPRSETPLNQICPQPNMAASSDQLYTITVSLEAVKFPPSRLTDNIPFFCCRWKDDCGAWITSEGRAIRDHMTRVHHVRKQENGSYCCVWVGCSASGEWSGMVRHVQTHLHLKWKCSVCEIQYSRRDCVRGHTKKVSGCNAARSISYPSELAYTARYNGDGTVTLTKMLQPTKAT